MSIILHGDSNKGSIFINFDFEEFQKDSVNIKIMMTFFRL